MQNWLMAAWPAAARSTVSSVAAAPRGEMSWRATPWLPAKIATSGRATTGGTCPVQPASHSAISSSRPNDPLGFPLWA